MKKSELRKISLKYRTLSSQMLKVDSQEEINYIKMYYDFITNTEIIADYIKDCHKQDYDFDEIYENKFWNDMLTLPDNEEDLVDYGYQLIEYVLSGKKRLHTLGQGYSSSRSVKDIASAFIRKAIGPFVDIIRNYLEMELVDAEDVSEKEEAHLTTVFLSYCQKDSDIADLVEEKFQPIVEGKVKISRDIRDVKYHESFKNFMQSIETHDFVIMLISDHYLKSRNCMFEVMEVVKDSQYKNKLIFIVLSDEDIQYYKKKPEHDIGAKVYSPDGQTSYSVYWNNYQKDLQAQIDAIGDDVYAVHQIKEKGIIQRILLDLPEFFEFIKDNKGLPLATHIEDGFSDIIKFMNL